MICEKCKKDHNGKYGSGRFCSAACARSFSTSNKRKEINEKVSNKLKGNRCIKGGLLKLCDYNCGQEAIHQLKNGNWCCEDSVNKCPALKEKNSKGLKLAHKEQRIPSFPKDAYLKGHESFRVNLQEKYDILPFEQKPLVEKSRIIKKEQHTKCQICGITDWCGKSLTLHLDHIDGDNSNNKRENLRYFCPICHRQTKTYCGKNIKKTITDKEFKNALKTTDNISQALKKCNLVAKGANYDRAKKLLKQINE